MPLTDQELRCVMHACDYLGASRGGRWDVSPGPALEDLYRNEPVPEVEVQNGAETAAVEVKRLTGEIWAVYRSSLLSLKQSLLPDGVQGYFTLDPWVDFRFPMSGLLKKTVQEEIARVAPGMELGEKRAICIPREATVIMQRQDGPGYVWCCHNANHPFGDFSQLVNGTFMLADDRTPEHQFISNNGQTEAAAVIAEACRSRVAQGNAIATWLEEWGLTYQSDAENGVWIVAVTEARDIPTAVSQCVDTMVEKAIEKFKRRRWGTRHVLVLEQFDPVMTMDRVKKVVEGFTTQDLAVLDVVLMVDATGAQVVWEQ